MASLEQLADDQQISPLSPPELDPYAIAIPKEGPFIYEFDIEVRPEFDLPDYKGLKLRRPTHTFTAAEVEAEQKRLLEPYGQLVPKEPPVVAPNDYITADVVISFNGKEINKLSEVRVKVDKQLALSDGVARGLRREDGRREARRHTRCGDHSLAGTRRPRPSADARCRPSSTSRT